MKNRNGKTFRFVKWTEKEKRKYRFALLILLLVNIGLLAVVYWKKVDGSIPNRIYFFQNQKAELNLHVPMEGSCREATDVIAINNGDSQKKNDAFGLDHPVIVNPKSLGSYKIELKLFGLIHYKYIHFDIIEKEKVMPSGRTVGLYIQSKGLMVLGTSKVQGKDGFSHNPANEILQPGDFITSVNGEKVRDIDQMIEILQKNGNRKAILELNRAENKIRVKVDTIETKDGQHKIGAWLREDTEGIGTISFVTKKNQFAALGHGITDIDTGKLIHLSNGKVYPAHIEDIKKGKAGNPGELIGSVELGNINQLGTIQSNTMLGITGTIKNVSYAYQQKKAYPVGLRQEVKKAEAYILCQLSDKVEKYKIAIDDIDMNSQDNKGMVIRITDKRLLKKTGGIVQGMSGCPIIQRGKIIGAVTHVFVDDATCGYGTFIENMIGKKE